MDKNLVLHLSKYSILIHFAQTFHFTRYLAWMWNISAGDIPIYVGPSRSKVS